MMELNSLNIYENIVLEYFGKDILTCKKAVNSLNYVAARQHVEYE
jgi:hypothetical protein